MAESSKRAIIETATIDLASVAANADVETTVTVAGVELGDVVMVSSPTAGAGLVLSGYVSAVNQVTVRASNVTTSAVDSNASNETQNILHDHTGGDFTISFDGQGPTGDMGFDDDGTGINTALELFSNIAAVTVTENATGDWDVEFTNPGNQDVALMTINPAGLTGGTTIDVTVVTPGTTGSDTVHIAVIN